MNDREKVQFLRQFQELLSEGGFVATYKFALLQALADLSVEHEPAENGSLRVPIERIAEKFIEYYWDQARPFHHQPRPIHHEVLRQSTKGQAEIVTFVQRYRDRAGGRLSKLQADGRRWRQLLRQVAGVVIEMPLWKLQSVGSTRNEFLYRHSEYDNEAIRLLPGVPLGFRTFHPLLSELIRGAWINHIHRIKANRELIGPQAELEEFLFGIDRSSLQHYRNLLRSHQDGECFYCGSHVAGRGDLDHFIPWSRYPIDLGHNFVFVHPRCNNYKRDHLAAVGHLKRWREQNLDKGHALANAFDRNNVYHDLGRTHRIATWAYEQGCANGTQLWIRGREFEPCDDRWKDILR